MSENAFYYNTLINSLVFSPNIKNDLKIYCSFFENNRDGFLYIVKCFGNYLEKHKGQNIFDTRVKNNIYEIANYLYEKFPYLTSKINDSDKLLLNDFLNAIKKYLNICSDSNSNYIKEQILMRNYGVKSKLSPYWQGLKQISDDTIDTFKNEYYTSISKDILFINLLNKPRNSFYNSDYKAFTLDKDFYRSINYFWLTSPEFRKNHKYYERIKFMISSNLEFLTDLIISGDFDDEEFSDIHNASIRLLKIKVNK